MKIFRKVKKIWYKIPDTVRIAMIIFIFVFPTWVILALLIRRWLTLFGEGLLIEAFGMLLDIFVIGIIILWLNERREDKRRIERWQEEIDDFRGWESEEAKFRILGNIKRLNRNGITRINLNECFLKNVDLSRAHLKGADLVGTNLEKADLLLANLERADLSGARLKEARLRGANLERANLLGTNLKNADLRRANLREADFSKAHLEEAYFREAHLKRADFWKAHLEEASFLDANLEEAYLEGAYLKRTKELTIEQLSQVKTLYQAELDPELEKQIKKKYPHLLEEPKEERRKPDFSDLLDLRGTWRWLPQRRRRGRKKRKLK